MSVKMSLIGMMLLMICSCVTPLPVMESCFVNHRDEKNRCALREFSIKKPNVGDRIEPAMDRPLEYTQSWMCISPEDWGTIVKPKLKEYYRAYANRD